MGVAGALNDNADVTAPVYSYAPNDYGFYNMAGNVSEWVMDVYRPGTLQDAQEFRPFRGNVFSTKLLDSEGNVADKLDYVQYDVAAIASWRSTRDHEAGSLLKATTSSTPSTRRLRTPTRTST